MNPPKGIDPKVWRMAYGFAFNWEENETLIEQMAEELSEIISKAIEAERTKIEELLKDPAAVRVNFLRGGIACQRLIDEAVEAERGECARIIDLKLGRGYAEGIRNRSNTTTEKE